MLIIRLTKNGFQANQGITPRLFEQVGNTVVRVICEIPYYEGTQNLENEICDYMNTSIGEEVEVKTDYVTINQSTGEDEKGKYIEQIDFQVYI